MRGCEPLLGMLCLGSWTVCVPVCTHLDMGVPRAGVCGHVCEWELWDECRAPVGTPHLMLV